MKAYAVIGAGYGDEGKGAMVDFLASKLYKEGNPATVVRFNGGAQAGHTVQTPFGKRHIFRHFGSGTLQLCSTYLTSDFIVNPIAYRQEREELKEKLSFVPRLSVDPNALVTFPLDMMINQALETSRGKHRHGSCGMGIGETVERNTSYYGAFKNTVADLERLTLNYLDWVKTEYGLRRLKTLGIRKPDHFDNPKINLQFIDDVKYFLRTVNVHKPKALDFSKPLIFEGAQGLGLDQKRGHFPYVTRSYTGLTNVRNFAIKNNINVLDIKSVYVTRCYATRHGAGPLEHEDVEHFANVNDPTNIHNEWQQGFRTAPLDIDRLVENIQGDCGITDFSVAITCLDQIDERINVVSDGKTLSCNVNEIVDLIVKRLGTETFYTGMGPDRTLYKEHKEFLDF